MQRTTCFLILNQPENLAQIQQLVGENFPELALQVSMSAYELLNLISSHGNGDDLEHRKQILITDSPNAVEVVNHSGIFVPMVLLERGESIGSPSEFSPNQVADLCDCTAVIESIASAIQLSTQYVNLKSQSVKLETLADRERKIIALASEGVPNKTIARRLGISIKTVEKNRRIAYSKLSVSSTAEMACLVTFGRFFASFAD